MESFDDHFPWLLLDPEVFKQLEALELQIVAKSKKNQTATGATSAWVVVPVAPVEESSAPPPQRPRHPTARQKSPDLVSHDHRGSYKTGIRRVNIVAATATQPVAAPPQISSEKQNQITKSLKQKYAKVVAQFPELSCPVPIETLEFWDLWTMVEQVGKNAHKLSSRMSKRSSPATCAVAVAAAASSAATPPTGEPPVVDPILESNLYPTAVDLKKAIETEESRESERNKNMRRRLMTEYKNLADANPNVPLDQAIDENSSLQDIMAAKLRLRQVIDLEKYVAEMTERKPDEAIQYVDLVKNFVGQLSPGSAPLFDELITPWFEEAKSSAIKSKEAIRHYYKTVVRPREESKSKASGAATVQDRWKEVLYELGPSFVAKKLFGVDIGQFKGGTVRVIMNLVPKILSAAGTQEAATPAAKKQGAPKRPAKTADRGRKTRTRRHSASGDKMTLEERKALKQKISEWRQAGGGGGGGGGGLGGGSPISHGQSLRADHGPSRDASRSEPKNAPASSSRSTSNSPHTSPSALRRETSQTTLSRPDETSAHSEHFEDQMSPLAGELMVDPVGDDETSHEPAVPLLADAVNYGLNNNF